MEKNKNFKYSFGSKEDRKRRKNYRMYRRIIYKTNSKVIENSTISIITLNVNGPNSSIKVRNHHTV